MIHETVRRLIERAKEEGLDVNNIILFILTVKENLDLNVDLSDEDHIFLIQNKVITKNYITGKFECLIPFYSHEEGVEITNPAKTIHNTIASNINDYRSLFQGIRVGISGDKAECIQKMSRFMIENPDIESFDRILEATNYYICNTDPTYISNASNFIYNLDKTGREVSKLKMILEEMELGGTKHNRLL